MVKLEVQKQNINSWFAQEPEIPLLHQKKPPVAEWKLTLRPRAFATRAAWISALATLMSRIEAAAGSGHSIGRNRPL